MPNTPYFSQYVSPNIVIVPTVSFCGPPAKKQKPIPTQTPVIVKNKPCEQNCDRNYQCSTFNQDVPFQENQCGCLQNKTLYNNFQKNECVVMPNTNSLVDTKDSQCDSSVIEENVSTSFTKADCEVMVKKTLSWASNYLKSIGQSHPNTPKQPKTFIPQLQKKEDVIINKSTMDEPYLNTPNTLHENTLNVENKHSLPATETKESQITNITKNPIKINLLRDIPCLTDYSNSKSDMSSEAGENPPHANDGKEVCNQNNLIHNDKPETTKYSAKYHAPLSPSRLTSQSRKYINKKYIEKRKNNLKNKNVRRGGESREEINFNKNSYGNKYKFGIQDRQNKIYTKINTKETVASTSKYVNNHNTSIRIKPQLTKKHINILESSNQIKKVMDKNINLRKYNPEEISCQSLLQHNTDKSTLPKLNESEIKHTHDGKNSMPIKSVVQVTDSFDLNVPSFHKTNRNKEDLRNKLKRKHQISQNAKFDTNLSRNDFVKQKCTESNTPKLLQESKKFKKIKLIIKLVCENSPESSESESDVKNNEYSLANVDFSFLDDFNVDDIVDCLRSPEIQKVHLNEKEPLKTKNEFITEEKSFKSTSNNIDKKVTKHISLLKETGKFENSILEKFDHISQTIKVENDSRHCIGNDETILKIADTHMKSSDDFVNKDDASKSQLVQLKKENENVLIQEIQNKIINYPDLHLANIQNISEICVVKNDTLSITCDKNIQENKSDIKPSKEINTNCNENLNELDVNEQCVNSSIVDKYTNKHIDNIPFVDISTQGEIETIIVSESDNEEDTSSLNERKLDTNDIKSLFSEGKDEDVIDITDLDEDDSSKSLQVSAKSQILKGIKNESSIKGKNIDMDTESLVDTKSISTLKQESEILCSDNDFANVITIADDSGSNIIKMKENDDINGEIVDDEENKITIQEESSISNTKDIAELSLNKDIKNIKKAMIPNEDVIKSNNNNKNINSIKRVEELKINKEITLLTEDVIAKNKCETGINISKSNISIETPKSTKSNLNSPYLKTQQLILESRMLQYFREEFKITNLISQGKFSKVFQCKNSQGRMYALKVTHPKQTSVMPVQEKGKMLQAIKKDVPKKNFYCIYIFDGFACRKNWCYLMEYYPNNLQVVLADNGKSFHIDTVQKLSRQLFSALVLLRNNNIAHLGIKPEHILLNSTNERLKLAGFDEAQYLNGVPIPPNIGTANYRPPEVILGFPSYVKADVWAAALIMYEMATNWKLFPGFHNNDILFKQQSMFGYIPFDMLEMSMYGEHHYGGMFFMRQIGKMGKVMIREFNKNSNRLNTAIYRSYYKDWAKLRTKLEVTEDKIKLRLFIILLESMLILHPRDRLPIEFAFTNNFIYE